MNTSSFEVLNITIQVSNENLSIALHKLSVKERDVILLRYFQSMSDQKIAELYHVSRSAIYRRRSNGLKKLKSILNFYNTYICKLCLRPFYHSESGKVTMQIDEELKSQIHTEMIKAVLKFEIRVK